MVRQLGIDLRVPSDTPSSTVSQLQTDRFADRQTCSASTQQPCKWQPHAAHLKCGLGMYRDNARFEDNAQGFSSVR